MYHKPYIIAELSGNHKGELSRAIQLIEAAKIAGADAVKLQTYTPDTITIDHSGDDFKIKQGLWKGKNLYQLYKEAHTPWDWHKPLFEKAKKLGITIFSSPFDETAVDLLESLNTPMYKVASFEITHIPLIRYVASTKKPMIISTGLADLEEISAAVQAARDNGCHDLTLLHCVSSYPASIDDSNLSMIIELKKQFPQCRVGLSDHSKGTTVSIAATAMGAEVIEKHVTLNRDEGGSDAEFSLEPKELEHLCYATKEAFAAIGTVDYNRGELENRYRQLRRSIYVVETVNPGDIFHEGNIKVIRPGFGMSPSKYQKVIGKRATKFCEIGTRLTEDLIADD